MGVYCVSYDLNKAGQDYEGLYGALKEFPDWWHYLDSTWLVSTNESAYAIFDKLHQHLDENDSLLIVQVGKDYSGWLSEEAWEWIKRNVR